jgi:uncharacterized protein
MLPAMLERQPAATLHDIGAARLLVSGKSFIADPTGAIYWPAENTLIVADLHLSNCSYLEGHDVLLPPYDTASSFEKLEEALDRYDPDKIVALGNSFGGFSSGGLTQHQNDWLQDMMEGREWYWVTGHENSVLPDGVGGEAVPHLKAGGITFRAAAVRAPVANEIAGGLHPVAQVSQYGHLMRGRCFVTNGMRLILPSIGNYAAGTNVLSPDFDPFLAQGGLFVSFISQGCVRFVPPPQLVEDLAA